MFPKRNDRAVLIRCRNSIAGFSLIELMVALTIAGILLLGMSLYFVNSSRTFARRNGSVARLRTAVTQPRF